MTFIFGGIVTAALGLEILALIKGKVSNKKLIDGKASDNIKLTYTGIWVVLEAIFVVSILQFGLLTPLVIFIILDLVFGLEILLASKGILIIKR